MEFLRKLNLTPGKVFKVIGIIVAIIVVLSIISISRFSVGSIYQSAGNGPMGSSGGGIMSASKSMGLSYGAEMSDMALSQRNIAPSQAPQPGADLEDFEVTEYSASIQTRTLEEDCAALEDLKPHEYVIFESANRHKTGCNYSFKVEREHVEEVLEVIEKMDPKNLSESVRTIKKQVDDYTSEEEILERKLKSIDDTLESAIVSYDQISAVATSAQDAESLSKIIDSKIRIIERLTLERLSVAAQLERLGRNKAEQLDRLDYTYFRVNVYENKYVDGEQLVDSWKSKVRMFVLEVNKILQGLTLTLVALFLLVFQYLIYIFILLFIAKYAWRAAKRIWQR